MLIASYQGKPATDRLSQLQHPIHLEDDRTKLLARFYWLRKNCRELAVPMGQEPILPADHPVTGLHPIVSGDLVELRTSNPARLPLPSTAILEMQWVLYRVLALAGAADSSQDMWDSDSDSDIKICLGPSNKRDMSPAALSDVVSNLSLSRPSSVPLEPKRDRCSRLSFVRISPSVAKRSFIVSIFARRIR
jgi:hypothetical protein